MKAVVTSAKGQVVIPKEIREKIGLKPGAKAAIEAVGDHAEIRALPENPIDFFCGVFKEGSSLTRALLRARKEEADRESETGT
jgi:AbrB family looped-hinge helix DNA binding protein